MKSGLKIFSGTESFTSSSEIGLSVDETTPVDPFPGYVTLMVSMLHEPFMSSDLKYIIIQNSYNYLRGLDILMSRLRFIMKGLRRL
jgi:hypothetical protein